MAVAQANTPNSPGNAHTRKKERGWLSNNALISGIVSAVVAGVISFVVASYQSQDAARQAVTGQQVQEVGQLEMDARTFVQVVDRIYYQRGKCVNSVASGCKVTDINPLDSPLISPELALGVDLANVSDTTATRATDSLEFYALQALSNVGSDQGSAAWTRMHNAYAQIIARCGQLIQGRR